MSVRRRSSKNTNSPRQKEMDKEKGKRNKPQENGGNADSDDSDVENEEGGKVIGGIYIPPAPIPACSTASVGPRLIISNIVITNFKSYAGRQVLGPFHKNFTSVIGPNGSGKSNVIDSMLFVFGYRANKIRSKKLSVVIHKSEMHTNIKSCSVEVHFKQIIDEGEDDYREVPNSTFVIGRTANIDNQSHYTINGKNARFKEVAVLLRSHGIDLIYNRFLILQGEVEQIAMMKPIAASEHETGMLEYLEDIIGTSRYKVPLEKLEAKVVQLNVERAEKNNKAKSMEKEVSSLEEPLRIAVHQLYAENKVARLKNKSLQMTEYYANNTMASCLKEKSEVVDGMTESNNKVKEINEVISANEKEISSIHKKLESLKTNREQSKESILKNEKRSTELKLEIGHANQKRKKAKEAKKQLESKLIQIKNIPEKNEKEIEELKKVEQKLTKARAEEEDAVEKALASLQEEIKEDENTLNELSNKLIGFKNIKDNANAKYGVAKTELDCYLSQEKKEIEKLENFKSSLNEIRARMENEEKLLLEATSNLPHTEQELTRSNAELLELKRSEHQLTQEVHTLMSKMQEKKNTMHDRKSRGRVLDFIMRQKEAGVVPGVFGRLGDLGGIDAKYDCAVSTACGPLDFIVTDTVSTARACVELLKKNNVGRSNFIALDQQEHLKAKYSKPLKTPENIPRLFDLIKVNDERVKPAFYFGLYDTLVANDLSQAKRCAYGDVRFRVVSLEGAIIETSGTMSGGGEKRSGRMGRSATVVTESSAEDFKVLEEQLNQLKVQLNNVEQRRAALETEIPRLNVNIKKWRTCIEANKSEVEELNRLEKGLKQQIKNQQSVVKEAAVNPEIVEKMTSQLNKLKKDLDTATENSTEVENEVKKVKSKIDAAMDGKMKEVRQKLEKTCSKLAKVTAEINKLGVGIKSCARDETKTVNRIGSLTNEIEENENAILKAEETFKNLLEKTEESNKNIEELNGKISELEKNVREIKSKSSSLNKEVSALKAAVIGEQQKLEAIEARIAEADFKLKDTLAKKKALKLHEIPKLGFNWDFEDPSEEDDIDLTRVYTPEEIEKMPDILPYTVSQMEEDTKAESRKVDFSVIDTYKEKVDLLKARQDELEAVTKLRNEVRQGFDDVRRARLNDFMSGFTIISSKLKEMYQMITLGGDAELELIDALDPFAEGVVFSVRPPKKSWKNISNLSGGEKTLSSLALVFALHYYKPSPLYVMDEIDAALDFRNVSIVGLYIKERTKNAQFIIISLRSNMFELADVLVGIYKTHNSTKSVTVTPNLMIFTGNQTQGPDVLPPKRARIGE